MGGEQNGRKAFARAAGVWKRASGSLAISRRTMAATSAGASGRSRVTGGGGSIMWLANFSTTERPPNGGCPVRAKKKVQPRL